MSRSNRSARQRLLAPIATLAACSAAAAALVVASSAASLAPSASAAVALPEAHRSTIGIPTFPISIPVQTTVVQQTTSQAAQTTAAATKTTAKAKHSTASAAASTESVYKSTFTPHAMPSVAVPTPSSTGCAPDTRAPSAGADMQLPQVSAGSTDSGFTNWLHVTAVGPSTMLPPKLNSSNLSTLTLTRSTDGESTNLGMAASSGERFTCALLDVSTGQGYQRVDYALTNAGFVSDSVQGKTETLIVTYSSVSWSYLPTADSTAVTGSGTINTQPDVAQTSLKRDAKDVAAGVLGLALTCVLGMLLLTLFGRHRRKVRYREVRERSRVEVPLPERQAASPTMFFTSDEQAADATMRVVAGQLPDGDATEHVLPGQLPDADADADATMRVAPDALPTELIPAVPDALKTVHVSEFAHARAVPVAAGVGAMPTADSTSSAPESAAPAPSAPESGLGGGSSAGESGPDPVDLPGPRGQDEPGELAAEVDADGEAEAGGGGGEQVGGAESGLPADDEQHAEVGLRAGEQGDESRDGEGQAAGSVPAGDELAAEPEQDAGGGDGDGGAATGPEEHGVADPGEGGAEHGVAEQPPADAQRDPEGEPEDGGGEGLEPGPGRDDEVVGGVEVDAEGDPGAEHDADPADDADDDVEDLDEPGGRGDVEGGEPVLDRGDEGAAGEQREEPAGDDR